MTIATLFLGGVGISVLFVVATTNWNKRLNMFIQNWIQRVVFRNGVDSEQRAGALFGVLTSILLVFGGVLLVFAI